MSKDKQDSGISMEEIDRRIDEMPVFDLRDPKVRKQTKVNIDDILESLNFEALLNTQEQADVKNIDENPEENNK